MRIDGVSPRDINYSIVGERAKEKKNSFAEIFNSINEKKRAEIELRQWYKLGTYEGKRVYIRLFPGGSYELSSHPIIWEDRGSGSSLPNMEAFLSLKEQEAITKDLFIWLNFFAFGNDKTGWSSDEEKGWCRIEIFSEIMRNMECTISDVERVISNASTQSVSSPPGYNFGNPDDVIPSDKEQGTEESKEVKLSDKGQKAGESEVESEVKHPDEGQKAGESKEKKSLLQLLIEAYLLGKKLKRMKEEGELLTNLSNSSNPSMKKG